ncbi:phage tail tape measure protein, partial [Ancylobacter sp. VKM B-3255]|nr:phage tail tape measure protein [Ancylobacter radicis]
GKTSRERQNDYERLTQMIQQRTAALNAETAAQAGINPLLDDYGAAVERARAEFDLLQAAQEAGLTITPQLRENIATLADAYADASVAAAQLQESQNMVRQKAEDMVDLGRDTMSGFISDIRNGTSAADALTNALGRVIDKLADMSINTLFDSKTGALGSLITSAFSGTPKFAEGG